jgi:hypothetical protein
MLQAGLVSLLEACAPLTALVGSDIYPVLMPEGVKLTSGKGGLTYKIVGGNSSPTFSSSGMQKVRIQFDAFGVNYIDAANIREAVRVLLNGFMGTLSDGTVIVDCELIQPIDFENNDARQFRLASEFYFMFNFTS